ncbi:hypothetical protein B7Y94_02840 [Candidatus Saccharibacteria bacterium 32-49-12]|nr:MAG: hypothetical protein B7Y94_02840 [Candidatus Saccharibacteria bacterium 32-49-12]
MKKLKNALAGLLVVPAVAVGSALVGGSTASAQVDAGLDATGQQGSSPSLNVSQTVTAVVNWLLFFVGVLAVIMLIWGGIKYATSAGDASKVTAAKNTILYAIIGLVIAILAYAIVSWVSGTFLQGGGLSNPS